MTLFARVSTALALVNLLPRVEGHAYLSTPMSRNWLAHVDPPSEAVREYCPHCLSGGGPGATSAAVPLWPYPETPTTARRHGVCGDPAGENQRYAQSGRITAEYTQGQIITLEVAVSTHHRGHFEFFLCDMANNIGSVTSECLLQTPLLRDPTDTAVSPPDARAEFAGRYYIEPRCAREDTDATYATSLNATALYTRAAELHRNLQKVRMRYQLPADLTCQHCVLQWVYVTGNSCNAPGYSSRAWPTVYTDCQGDGPGAGWWGSSLSSCVTASYPEEFWNCADISITSSSPTPHTPEPSQQPTSNPTTPTVGGTQAPTAARNTLPPTAARPATTPPYYPLTTAPFASSTVPPTTYAPTLLTTTTAPITAAPVSSDQLSCYFSGDFQCNASALEYYSMGYNEQWCTNSCFNGAFHPACVFTNLSGELIRPSADAHCTCSCTPPSTTLAPTVGTTTVPAITVGPAASVTYTITAEWNSGCVFALQGRLRDAVSSWSIVVTMSTSNVPTQVWNAVVHPSSNDLLILTNAAWNGNVADNGVISFGGIFHGSCPRIVAATVNDHTADVSGDLHILRARSAGYQSSSDISGGNQKSIQVAGNSNSGMILSGLSILIVVAAVLLVSAIMAVVSQHIRKREPINESSVEIDFEQCFTTNNLDNNIIHNYSPGYI